MVRCPNCRRPVDDDDEVCVFCDQELTGGTERADDSGTDRGSGAQPREKGTQSTPSGGRGEPTEGSPRPDTPDERTSPRREDERRGRSDTPQSRNRHRDAREPRQGQAEVRRGSQAPRSPEGRNTERNDRSVSRRAVLLGGAGLLATTGGAWFLLGDGNIGGSGGGNDDPAYTDWIADSFVSGDVYVLSYDLKRLNSNVNFEDINDVDLRETFRVYGLNSSDIRRVVLVSDSIRSTSAEFLVLTGSFETDRVIEEYSNATGTALLEESTRSGYGVYEGSDEWLAMRDGEIVVGNERRAAETVIDARTGSATRAVEADESFRRLNDGLEGPDFYSITASDRIDAELFGNSRRFGTDETAVSFATVHTDRTGAETASETFRSLAEDSTLSETAVRVDNRRVVVSATMPTRAVGPGEDPAQELGRDIVRSLR